MATTRKAKATVSTLRVAGGAARERFYERPEAITASIKPRFTVESAEGTGRYANYISLVQRANQVFGDELIASRWLSSPSEDLKGLVPLQVAQAMEYSMQALEDVFIRIEHGVYS